MSGSGGPPEHPDGLPKGRAEPPEGRAEPSLQRLDPDRGQAQVPEAVEAEPLAPPPRPVIEARRYGWMIGIFGLLLVVGVSIYQFATHGIGTTGVPPGRPLHLFAAPLAATNLDGDPTANPTCSPARHDPRALNICLLERRGPLVISFFVTGAAQCVRQVDALQALSRRYPAVQFAAVAVGGAHAATARLVRRHHWTIPVAYDRDGRVGSLYSVAACPMVEMAARGGVVADRLVGDRWEGAASLAPHVRALVAAPGA
ncbi:MAG: hypothetical protein WBQ18_18565 [Solirubrobacteraceae bacterium]